MEYYKDTIAAISTPSGTAALHVLRLSGEEAIAVIDGFLPDKDLFKEPARKAVFARFSYDNELIDEVVVTKFIAPKSYTGEDMVEISCHGNQFVADHILELLLNKVRLALPGEFTQRAFMNNKLDLTQAEAVGDLLSAKTRFAQRSALNQLEGKLYKKIAPFLSQLTDFRIQLELEIDFSEDDTGDIDLEQLKADLETMVSELSALSASGRDGVILREGYKVCLAGQPNVGKSSIFNRMLETERAIVTPEPGTTRDYLEEALALEGFLVRLYDTAGIRKTESKIEKLGIERSFDVVKGADLIVYVCEGEENPEELKQLEKLNKEVIKVINKYDLIADDKLEFFKSIGYIPASAVQQNGLTCLKKEIIKRINIDPKAFPETMLTNSRQIAAVNNSIENIQQSIRAIEDGMSVEFIAFDLQEASRNLEEIIGAVSNDDILNRIFSSFCIGK